MKAIFILLLTCIGLLMVTPAYSAPLRSFAIMPVEKNGSIMRLTLEQMQNVKTNMLMTNIAYGISSNQALLLGLPTMLSPSRNFLGEVSVLYRHVLWQKDSQIVANSLGILGGAIVPTDDHNNGGAIQAGLVYTHIQQRNQVDMDMLYQIGMNNRVDSGRYDVSWQYRLSPNERADWGVTAELNSVLEYNGRWREGSDITHQVTAGLQWVHQTWVLENAFIQDLNHHQETRYQVSTRFHF